MIINMWNRIAACKELAERDALVEHVLHKEKMMKIKSRINNKPPKLMRHLLTKGKKKLEACKVLTEIHHSNQLLLEKLEKVKGCAKGSTQLCVHVSEKISRAKFEEILKIDGENNRILTRIQSVKSYYSARKHKKDYLFSKYLSGKLSENARRIPKIASFNQLEMNEFLMSQKGFRPMTASGGQRSKRVTRPTTAKMIKEGL